MNRILILCLAMTAALAIAFASYRAFAQDPPAASPGAPIRGQAGPPSSMPMMPRHGMMGMCPCGSPMGMGMRGHPMGMGMGGMGMGMGPEMWGAIQADPKAMGKMLELRGEMLKEMGDVMVKKGKAMRAGK